MKKGLLKVSFFCLSLFHYAIELRSSAAIQAHHVIAWDLHDVVMQKQKWRMAEGLANLFWNARNKWDLVKTLVNPYFWSYLLTLRSEHDVLTEVIDQLMVAYPVLREHRNTLIEVLNLHEPIEETVTLIKRLKENGYKQYLASNMTQESYDIISTRYPKVFELFDGVYLVGKKNARGALYANKAKPYLQYFVGLRAFLSDMGVPQKTNIIFIDDKLVNIEGAKKAHIGIEPMLFISATQVRSQLEEHLSILWLPSHA